MGRGQQTTTLHVSSRGRKNARTIQLRRCAACWTSTRADCDMITSLNNPVEDGFHIDYCGHATKYLPTDQPSSDDIGRKAVQITAKDFIFTPNAALPLPPPSTTASLPAVTCSHRFCGLKNRDAYGFDPFASCILTHCPLLPVDTHRFLSLVLTEWCIKSLPKPPFARPSDPANLAASCGRIEHHGEANSRFAVN